jgi:hypothetical protein
MMISPGDPGAGRDSFRQVRAIETGRTNNKPPVLPGGLFANLEEAVPLISAFFQNP